MFFWMDGMVSCRKSYKLGHFLPENMFSHADWHELLTVQIYSYHKCVLIIVLHYYEITCSFTFSDEPERQDTSNRK